MKYHKAILELVDAAPLPSDERLAIFKERETSSGAAFPPSVWEWFALKEADSLFEKYTSPDFLTPINELGGGHETRQGYLRVATENQGVVTWYVRLDQGDDPAVYSTGEESPTDLSAVKWHMDAASFSGFVFNMMSSGRFGGWMPGWFLEANEPMPDARARQVLVERFRQGPMSENAAVKVYRYYDPHGFILIASKPDSKDLGTWAILAESEDWLYNFVKRVWDIGTLSSTLTAEGRHPAAPGPRVLKRVRDEMKKGSS